MRVPENNHFVEIIATIRHVEAENNQRILNKWDAIFVRSMLCFIAFAAVSLMANHFDFKEFAKFLFVPMMVIYALLVAYCLIYLTRVAYKGLTTLPGNHSLLSRSIQAGDILERQVVALSRYSNLELLSFAAWVEHRAKTESKLSLLVSVVLASPLMIDIKQFWEFDTLHFSLVPIGTLVAIFLFFVLCIRFLSVYWDKYQFYARYTVEYRELYTKNSA